MFPRVQNQYKQKTTGINNRNSTELKSMKKIGNKAYYATISLQKESKYTSEKSLNKTSVLVLNT